MGLGTYYSFWRKLVVTEARTTCLLQNPDKRTILYLHTTEKFYTKSSHGRTSEQIAVHRFYFARRPR
jgi:hypothetical protein